MRTRAGENLFLTWFAVIGVCLTLLTGVAWLAFALVATHSVMANGTVAARTLHALVDVNFACLTLREEMDM